jgi:hypothetical protein
MEWKVAIENQPNQRILVRFDPLAELLIFSGQYKPHNKEWTTFGEEICGINNVDAIIIQEKLLEVYQIMEKRLNQYKNIEEGFTLIKTIEIQKED